MPAAEYVIILYTDTLGLQINLYLDKSVKKQGSAVAQWWSA